MRTFSVVAAAVAVALAPAMPAHAATPRFVVAVATTFVPGDQTITAGDPLTLVNAEPSPHDITSTDLGSDGFPLFLSETLYQPGTTPVRGVEALEPGAYAYYCSVHLEMRGSIVVQ
jgi:spore coat protein A